MTEQICKNCKHWEYEYIINTIGVGCCTNDQKYKDISFGRMKPRQFLNGADLPQNWYCSIETDEDDHCKYWEATDD